LIFRGLAGFVVTVCVQKAIPHFVMLPTVHKHTSMHYLRLISTKTYIKY
jgi:hypothetical protein